MSNTSGPPPCADLMAQAVVHHQQGDVLAARRLYQRVLDQQPDHAGALHLLGVIAGQMGSFDQAIELIGRAVHIDQHNAAAHNNLGNAFKETGRYDLALACHDRAIALAPGFPQAHNSRGVALQQLKRPRDALDAFTQAIRLQPDFVEPHMNRGVVLLGEQRPAEALDSFDRTLMLAPHLAGAHQNRGAALIALQRYESALASFESAQRLDPGNADVHLGRADVLTKAGRHDEALHSLDRAIALRPADSQAHFTRGTVLQATGSLDAALEAYQRAIALAPTDPRPHYNKGTLLQRRGLLAEAIGCYEQAVAADPAYAQAHWNCGLCHLLLGNLVAGWRGFEWRYQVEGTSSSRNRREFPQPLWNGSQDVGGQTILLYEEQGFGDAVQCVRYAALLAERGAEVVLEVPAALKPLLDGANGVTRVLTKGEPLPRFDLYCPLMSLPHAFGTTLATIPAPGRYLQAPASRVQKWRTRLGPRCMPRIGLVWSGNPRHLNDLKRSIPLAQLVPLLSGKTQFFSLQKQLRPQDEAALRATPQLIQLAEELGDFADTAAVIEQMDLVISVDTSVAHVAGALGRRVWVMLPEPPDWRWMLGRADSPWYPSARLFRQESPGDWHSVIDRVRRALAAMAW